MRCEAPSVAVLSLLALVSVGCDGGSADTSEASLDPALSEQATPDLDIAALRAATGVDGEEDGGEWKWTVPQNDLEVSVDGFRIVPPMGMGSWAAFTPAPKVQP